MGGSRSGNNGKSGINKVIGVFSVCHVGFSKKKKTRQNRKVTRRETKDLRQNKAQQLMAVSFDCVANLHQLFTNAL